MDHNFEVLAPRPTTVLRKKIDIPFKGNEKTEFETFLRETGRTAGPWTRLVILDAMAKAKEKSNAC